MYRTKSLFVAAVVVLLVAASASAAVITSNGTGGGNYGSTATWNGGSVPLAGDSVIITANDVVTVTDLRVIGSVQLDTTSGTKVLDVQSGGNVTITGTGNALLINAPTIGVHTVQLSGGSINVQNGDVAIFGGISTVARVSFAAGGGLLTAKQLLFSGTAANAQVNFPGGSGSVNLQGDLSSGGTINSAGSTFTFDGSGSQTINPYTFHNLTVNKTGTAVLNGPITVNGNLAVTNGLLDDGGYQISLNAGTTSLVTIGNNGVLKLGSATSATGFPSPVNG
ncbi:MAG TPA: hypothetical protein VN181_13340, partial [Thermoanaerobaculia bacterium]|nr:hypothetical protein [Thermoanaerobaculia bacterium]